MNRDTIADRIEYLKTLDPTQPFTGSTYTKDLVDNENFTASREEWTEVLEAFESEADELFGAIWEAFLDVKNEVLADYRCWECGELNRATREDARDNERRCPDCMETE